MNLIFLVFTEFYYKLHKIIDILQKKLTKNAIIINNNKL